MPSYTLGEIMSFATADIGRRADIPQSVASRCANQAYFEVAGSGEFALQERRAVSSTTSGENAIDLPTDFAEPIAFWLEWSNSTSSSAVSNRRVLERVTTSYIDGNNPNPVGVPTAYAFFNSYVELYPSPDSAYSLHARYRSQVTDMIATSDIPSIATSARYAIVLKTQEMLHRYVGNYAGAAALEQSYLNYMTRIKSDEYRRQMSESPMGLQVMFDRPTSRRAVSRFDLESF